MSFLGDLFGVDDDRRRGEEAGSESGRDALIPAVAAMLEPIRMDTEEVRNYALRLGQLAARVRHVSQSLMSPGLSSVINSDCPLGTSYWVQARNLLNEGDEGLRLASRRTIGVAIYFGQCETRFSGRPMNHFQWEGLTTHLRTPEGEKVGLMAFADHITDVYEADFHGISLEKADQFRTVVSAPKMIEEARESLVMLQINSHWGTMTPLERFALIDKLTAGRLPGGLLGNGPILQAIGAEIAGAGNKPAFLSIDDLHGFMQARMVDVSPHEAKLMLAAMHDSAASRGVQGLLGASLRSAAGKKLLAVVAAGIIATGDYGPRGGVIVGRALARASEAGAAFRGTKTAFTITRLLGVGVRVLPFLDIPALIFSTAAAFTAKSKLERASAVSAGVSSAAGIALLVDWEAPVVNAVTAIIALGAAGASLGFTGMDYLNQHPQFILDHQYLLTGTSSMPGGTALPAISQAWAYHRLNEMAVERQAYEDAFKKATSPAAVQREFEKQMRELERDYLANLKAPWADTVEARTVFGTLPMGIHRDLPDTTSTRVRAELYPAVAA